MIFSLGLYCKDKHSEYPADNEIERPEIFLERIQYIIDYATIYYMI